MTRKEFSYTDISLVNLLTENRLQERLGTCKIEFSTSVLEIGIILFVTKDRDPSTTLTFCPPKHGVHDENNCEQTVIWFVAPESMIQGAFTSEETLEVMKKSPFWVSSLPRLLDCENSARKAHLFLFGKWLLFRLAGFPWISRMFP